MASEERRRINHATPLRPTGYGQHGLIFVVGTPRHSECYASSSRLEAEPVVPVTGPTVLLQRPSRSLYFGLVLFCAGVAMAYFFVLPLALIFLTGFQQEFLQPMLEVGQYLAFVTKLLVAFGVAFELPVVIMILSALGLVTPRFLRDKRRHAIVGITVLASLLTPGDLASTILMIIPMMILYEGSIFLSVMIYRKREESLSDEPLRPSEEAPSGAVEADPWGHGA
jgi:hypothetical protein